MVRNSWSVKRGKIAVVKTMGAWQHWLKNGFQGLRLLQGVSTGRVPRGFASTQLPGKGVQVILVAGGGARNPRTALNRDKALSQD